MEQNSLCPSEQNADEEKLPIKQTMKSPQDNISCLHCGKIFSRHSHLILHTYRAHKTTVYLSEKSSKCTYITANKNLMKRHAQVHINLNQGPKEIATLCLFCGKTFSKLSNLNRHTIRVHKTTVDGAQISDKDVETKMFLCESCGKHFLYRHGLKRHMEAVHYNLSDKCSKCTFTDTNKSHMKRHIDNVHNQTPKENATLCFHCGKTFSNLSNLMRHTIRLHKTTITGAQIPDKDTVTIRKTTERFPCMICDKHFLWRHSLQRHVKAVHVTREPDELNDADTESSLVDYEQTIYELQEPILHEISKKSSENHPLDLDAKKKIVLEEFHMLVTTKVSTSDQLDIINRMLKEAAVTVNAMNEASA